jgi:hypothetical protein
MIQRNTGVPSRGAVLIGDQPPALIFSDMMALSLRTFQAANRHANDYRENVMARFVPGLIRDIPCVALRQPIPPNLRC